ncbi:MAG: Penicillin-binding protein [Candidatus Falkowbacteria bacterium GW2011_GWA2_41_14]|uniref:Penicillin-binding protein n=1 Tax=Candidatus Falkowbacteria bacterium GW2011_GWA2_41_14 TaxID=1618635 RepID=A0A0G0USJ6_9BACT|nr:MAG: Penicillin-binding protein [Candidatus Falkowbacteria bacterium GW2011_GWA2_41_14]
MARQSQISVKIIFSFLILLLAQMAGGFIYAAEPARQEENSFFININKATTEKGYAIKPFGGLFNLILPKGILKDASGVAIKKVDEPMDLPWQLEKLSEIYQYELFNKAAYNGKKPLIVEMKYNQPSDYYKQIYFYDNNYLSWRPLPCKEIFAKSLVRCEIFFSFARLAVFANPNTLVIGRASWYSYKKGDFTASPDFPKGSKLRVYNLDNGKFVDVIVNDFGPERKLHPDRAVDLEKTAFSKIASLKKGTIKVRVELISLGAKPERLFGISNQGARNEPVVTAKAAVLLDEQTGDILWQKNATSTLPLASLTKLVAIKVFLDTRPSLNSLVTYSVKDEEYNYEYVNKWESARLKLADGDILTVEDLLYAALVGSANNAIETLVRVSGLARNEFIKNMNDLAANWSASSTHFIEPTGLSPENVSSALDYAIISKEVFAHPIIQKASAMHKYKFATLNTKKPHTIVNTDKLLEISSLNITGSKTGYLDEAGYCLMVRAADDKDRSVIAVVMGASSRDKSFAETEELLKYGLKTIIIKQESKKTMGK